MTELNRWLTILIVLGVTGVLSVGAIAAANAQYGFMGERQPGYQSQNGYGMMGSGMGGMMSTNGMGMMGSRYGNMMGSMMEGNDSSMQSMMSQHGQYCTQMMTSATEEGLMPNHVVIMNYSFIPQTLKVPVGTTVTWVNMDFVAHSVESGIHDAPIGLFESELLDHMESFSYTFSQPGTYIYHCDPHPWMTGTIVVEG